MSFKLEALAALKTAYLAWANAGCPQSYMMNGRSVTKADMEAVFDRINALEADVARETSGSFAVAQFRDAE